MHLERSIELDWILPVVFNSFPSIDIESIKFVDNKLIIYKDGHTLTIDNTFFSDAVNTWLSIDTLPKLPLTNWNLAESILDVKLLDDNIPVLFGEAGFYVDPEGSGHLKLDILGAAFFMLSRYEEVIAPSSSFDIHNRFPAKSSIAYKADYLERPIIDEYIEILYASMKCVWPRIERKMQQAKTLVSHDVDIPSLYGFKPITSALRLVARDALKRRDIESAFRGSWSWFISKYSISSLDPYNTFDWIMDISEKNNLTSAFYFICGRTDPSRDARYDIEQHAIRRLLRKIDMRGHEIGLHSSYNTYANPESMASEANALKQVCYDENIPLPEFGGRMHYLRWQMPTTLYGCELSGMAYDCTLGYADRPGFRCGTCHEYQAFDPFERKIFNFKIRPLIAMECSIIEEKYLGLGYTSESYDKFVNLKKACQSVNGNFTLLWHNSAFSSNQQRELYEKILAY